MAKTLKVNYEKRKNTELFKAFQSEKGTFLSNPQNFIPIYNRFFMLNETNFNSVNLNHKWFLTNVKNSVSENKNLFHCSIQNKDTNKIKKAEVFFKMAPLLDPFKYLVGKYDVDDVKMYNLPKYNSTSEDTHTKFTDMNNSAYVDGLFSFLSSLLIYKYNFIHGVDYFGSFLAIKNSFKLNVIDDLEYLCKSDFFNKNKNIKFQIEDYSFLFNNDENKPLVPIKIDYLSDKANSNLSLKSISNDLFDDLFESEELCITLEELKEQHIDLVDITNSDEFSKLNDSIISTIKSNSTCSSRTSHTTENCNCKKEADDDNDKDGEDGENGKDGEDGEDGEDCEDGEEDGEGEDGDEDISSDGEEQRIDATIPKFPVQVICMEYCENTFDDLIMNEELTQDEWFSALMQIIMILITYQKVFSFTHNDLHTNNVMYNTTDKNFIYYCYKKKYYKVPTFGRIFKIIDFGRGIYKFDGNVVCSDSFQHGADASTQYNTEPYFNEKKPRLEPNYSFDLCRLACSIFDYVIEDLDSLDDLKQCEPIVKLIVEWCMDDNGVNILYKNNGDERYPDFKLYKMIARCVHNHTPNAQLDRPEFNAFCIAKNDTPSNEKCINIDEIPSFSFSNTNCV